MDQLSLIGNVCSIVSLALSVWLLIRTGKIEKNVGRALERENKMMNFKNMRKRILRDMTDSASFLINEHTPAEQLQQIQKLDSSLADLATHHPSLSDDITKKIGDVRTSCAGARFSYIGIIRPLNDIISLLKQEGLTYYD